ncbi:SUMF1/EgtB/PvdO family nonheme iron enzyme [bacterium]|nr:SUMF1/EgtB/PvdO family nonheme iron enzyme [bacterium]
MTTPFYETAANQPSALPPGVDRTLDGYRLAEIDLIWVPSVTAWLGDELTRPAVANPIRQVTCDGFFIAHTPIREDGEVVHMTFAEAQARCATLSAETGAVVRLPSADEWEIAARGTDGRRFPWGNALPRPQFEDGSPWGMADATGVHGQWCVDGAWHPLVVGGVAQWRCSMRRSGEGGKGGVSLRVVVEAK